MSLSSASPPYVELHAHSAFSFLDGASTPLELAAGAASLGYPALALTDHDGLWGSMEFAHACKGFGIHPITGAEITISLPLSAPAQSPPAPADGTKTAPYRSKSAHRHLTLLVEDAV